MVNLLSGMGTSRDVLTHATWQKKSISKADLSAIYRNWLAAKIVDIPVDDALRNWRKVKSATLSAEEMETIHNSEKTLRLRKSVERALKWSRLYGGAGILMQFDDGLDPMEPLDITRIKRDSLRKLHVFDMHDLNASSVNTRDPLAANYREVEYYKVAGTGYQIHASRFLIFQGRDLPWEDFANNQYWGGSYIEPIYDDIVNAKNATQSIAGLPSKAVIDMIGVEGLYTRVGLDGAELDAMIQAFVAKAVMKSTANVSVYDKDLETPTQQSISFGGLPDVGRWFQQNVGSGGDIPLTRYLGESAPGLNSTGKAEQENYYNSVAKIQDGPIRENLEYFDQIHQMSLRGRVVDDWEFEFEPLYQPNALEIAQREQAEAQTDATYLHTGVVERYHVKQRLKKEGRYDITDEEIELDRAEAEADEPEAREETEESPFNSKAQTEEQTPEGERRPGTEPRRE